LANADIGALWQITRGGKLSAEDSAYSRTFAGICVIATMLVSYLRATLLTAYP